MARGRMISKSLSTSAKYASLLTEAGPLGEFAQSLYPLLVAHADDFGRQAGDPFTVKHAVCPASPRGLLDINVTLSAMHKVGLIEWYEADGRMCLQVSDFDRHQLGLHKRTKSAFPDPSGKFPEIPSELNRTEQNRTEGKGTEQKDRADAIGERFARFWHAYPRKVGKEAARKVWRRLTPNEELTAVMLAAVASQRQSAQWRKDHGEFIPHPSTWLHQGRWEDQPMAPQAPEGHAERLPWICRHVDPCAHRRMCEIKLQRPAKYPIRVEAS